MKSTKISELPIVPENYAVDTYERISDMDLSILMTETERRFINGLIKYYEPENIIELGVHRGGGTVNILNAASESSRVVSIDKATDGVQYDWIQYDKTCRIGEILTEKYPNFKKDNWKLITGKDPSEVMDELNMKFDFAVIDTAHIHPCETLNFISILPYMNDGAIVIMHDIVNYIDEELQYAPRLLMSAVCAEKMLLRSYEPRPFPNIVAFQITQDTRKYIQGVFDVLAFPWAYFNRKDISNVYNLVKTHYTHKQILTFEMAVNINKYLALRTLTGTYDKLIIENVFKNLNKDTIFYGAGQKCNAMLEFLLDFDIEFNFQIWDMNADNIKKIFDKPVILPNFETKARLGQIMVITIDGKKIADSIRKQFEPLGYIVYHGIKSLFSEMARS